MSRLSRKWGVTYFPGEIFVWTQKESVKVGTDIALVSSAAWTRGLLLLKVPFN